MSPGRDRRGRFATAGTLTLCAGLWLVALAALLGPLHGDRALADRGVPPWLLALLFAGSEVLRFHIRLRRGAHAYTLSEIPLVLGLAAVAPLALVGSRVAGTGAVLVLFFRQRGFKLAVNLTLAATGTTFAAALYRLVLGDAAPSDPRGWVAALIAVACLDTFVTLFITLAVVLHDDPGEWRRLPASLAAGLVPGLVNTCIALVVLLTVEQDAWAVLLLLVVTGVAYFGYRRYEEQSEAHARVERLYSFTHALGGSREVEEVARAVLLQARDQLRALEAELVLPAETGASSRRITLSGQDVFGIDAVPAWLVHEQWWAPATRGRAVLHTAGDAGPGGTPARPAGLDGMAVPLPLAGSADAVLAVRGRLPDVRRFDAEDLRLFETLANHAGVSLANGRLIERLRQQAAEREYEALHDSLTGLPNRRAFQQRLDDAVTRGAAPAAVMLMDLDRFKDVNDTLGHDTGDRLLCEAGTRLQDRLGNRGLVARLGGDEFAVLLPSVAGADQACTVARELHDSVGQPFEIDDLTLDVRASIGVALAPDHGTTATTLLRHADVAMYDAKSTQFGVELYQPESDRNSRRRLAMVAQLRDAIDRDLLDVAYQPTVATASAHVRGAEALVRWQHPELGTVTPDEFVPLAEQSGLIRPLTHVVLERALRECAGWRARGHDIGVAVNLSVRSLADTALPDDVALILRRTGVPATALTLEVTESSIMSDFGRSASVLERLAAQGVTLAIDDFGTGHSSLAYLRRLPVHVVKIDRSFVRHLADDDGDRAIVRSTIRLGHDLGLRVVAEGVEDDEALAFLTLHGCDVVQGFLVSPPLDAPTMAAWLDERAADVDDVAVAAG